MIGIANHLSDELLERLIASETALGEEKEAETHLKQCAKCRASLESLAAGEKLWKEAGESLRDSAVVAPPKLKSRGFSSVTGEHCPHEAALPAGFFEASDNPAMIGRLGRFEILEEFARGGMGIILKGYDRQLNRYVAVKVLSPTLAASGAARKRFVREAQAAAGVVHPNVMPIHTVEPAGLLPYLVMPFVPGETLQDRIDREGPLRITEILRISKQIAEALAAAHAQGIVHRDVKPGNVLLEKGVERAVLADFGLARAIDDATVTQYGAIAGTPAYMSPEQARGDAIDARSDLFSLGSVMYAMCCGVAPFRAETSLGVLRRISDAEPRGVRDLNPEIPAWLARIVDRLQAKESADRYPSAAELAKLLENCLAHVQQPTRIPLPTELRITWPTPTTNQIRAGILIVGFIPLSIFLAATYWPKPEQTQPIQPLQTAPQPSVSAPSQTSPLIAEKTESAPASTPQRFPVMKWQDGTDEELEQISQEASHLESEIVGARKQEPR
jgi:serine/threonine protein kinase